MNYFIIGKIRVAEICNAFFLMCFAVIPSPRLQHFFFFKFEKFCEYLIYAGMTE